MKQAFYCIIIVTLFVGLVESQAGDAEIRVVSRWLGSPWSFDASAIPDNQRGVFIAELKKHRDKGDPTDQNSARTFLIELGDRETAEKVVAEFQARMQSLAKSDRARLVLGDTTQPWLIPMLAANLFIDEDPNLYLMGDVGYLPLSTAAAWAMRCIAARSSAFSAEVRESAERTYLNPNHGEYLRDTLRQWWQQNKEHFEKKDYTAVTPLQPVANQAPPQKPVTHSQAPTPAAPSKPATRVASVASQRLLSTIQASTGSITPVVPQAGSPKISKPVPSAPVRQAEPNRLPWELVAAGALFLAVIVGWALRYKKRRNP